MTDKSKAPDKTGYEVSISTMEDAEKVLDEAAKDDCALIRYDLLDDLISGCKCWNEALANDYSPLRSALEHSTNIPAQVADAYQSPEKANTSIGSGDCANKGCKSPGGSPSPTTPAQDESQAAIDFLKTWAGDYDDLRKVLSERWKP